MKNHKKKLNDINAIQKGIRKIKRNKRAFVLLFLGFIPVCVLASIFSNATHINNLIFIGIYLFLVIGVDLYLALTSICPKCNEFYYWKMSGIGYRNFFTNHCLNCGLELDEKKFKDKIRGS